MHCGLKIIDFKQSVVKENSFRTHVKMALIEHMSTELIFYFIGLERLNTHTFTVSVVMPNFANVHFCHVNSKKYVINLDSED